jgi:NADP-dependent 3-hydroxy acid dehydrogenase YdfG
LKNALVTGASGAIGGAVARALLDEGYRVFALGRDADRLQALSTPRTDRLVALAVDLDRPEATQQIAVAVSQPDAGLDLLVHAAGVYGLATWAEGAEDDPAILAQQLRSHVENPWRLTRDLLPALERARGEVVFVNSSAGVSGAPPAAGLGPYAAAKAAERALADSLRQEVNPAGIRVLSIYPGRTAGRIQEALHAAEGRTYRPEALVQPADVAAAILAAIRLPRTAEITDLHLRPFQPPGR